MNERIKKLAELTLAGKMFPQPTKTEYDRMDYFLPKIERETKRICEYIENQEPVLNEYCALTGLLSFDGSCIGDAFNMSGHNGVFEMFPYFYLKSIDNLSVMEWQHASGDYKKVLAIGIDGIIAEIDESEKNHTEPEKLEFLQGLKRVCRSIIKWAHKCSAVAAKLAEETKNPNYRSNLSKLSVALLNVPQKGASSFYEALLCINLCYSFNPDSFGTLDRYIKAFYDNDIEKGVITCEQAKEYLQEFLLTPQARNTPGVHWTKGGQSHFCVGGYDKDGNDSYSDITKLIIESLMELPTYIPQITFRWTEKTPHEVFRYVMDCERKDRQKRIAFTNDQKRIKGYTQICKIPFEKAIEYTMVGCNEPTIPGSVSASTSKGNLLRSVETLFHKKTDLIKDVDSFDAFYAIFEKEMYADLDIIYDYDDKYNLYRAKDNSYVSSIFFNDCIDNAKSLTNGGGNTAISSPMILGIINVIDSLAVVKQFVFEEKRITMSKLTDALKSNWNGYEELLVLIKKKACFFGNDDELSNGVAGRVYESIYMYLKDKRTIFGYPIILGDHTGYNEHFKWFGEKTNATPDGRHKGDLMKYGLSQSAGYDRNGLTALLNSVANVDPNAIGCGSTVTNITVENEMVANDKYFEYLVSMMETYFKNGGMHFQLNYVSKEDLINAKKDPENHQNVRVRVTGFSEYFVKLQECFQDTIIERTTQK